MRQQPSPMSFQVGCKTRCHRKAQLPRGSATCSQKKNMPPCQRGELVSLICSFHNLPPTSPSPADPAEPDSRWPAGLWSQRWLLQIPWLLPSHSKCVRRTSRDGVGMAGERSLKGGQKHDIAEGRQMARRRNRSRDCIVGRRAP